MIHRSPVSITRWAVFDPYYVWLGIPPQEQPPHYYRLLGIAALEEKVEAIEHAADQRMAHLRTLQTGPHAALAQKLLNEVAAARVCLLNPAKKAAYDAALRNQLPPAVQAQPATKQESPERFLGEYEIIASLANSRTGPVFKARHRTMGRVVAVKVLTTEAVHASETLERFRRKVRILANLSHPNLVAAFDAGEREGSAYLVMEYIDGQDLGRLLKAHGQLPVAHAASYVAQAAAGLGYAHACGVIHRNVKPSNLMVDRQGVVKVIGLGLARVLAPDPFAADDRELTVPGTVMGTREYMAPEQGADSRSVDHRADIYSLGCTLHALLTGRPPYLEKSPVKQVLAHRDAPIPSLRAARPDMPAALDALFQCMMAKRPEDRPPTMNEVISSLQGR
jgi:serine/threonine protein kinase